MALQQQKPSPATVEIQRRLHGLQPRPAKVSPPSSPARVLAHQPAAQRSATKLIDHIQVLVWEAPAVVQLLERWAERFRHRAVGPRSRAELVNDALHHVSAAIKESRMAQDPNADAHESALRLIDLIHALTPERPDVVHAVERCVRALVVSEVRQRIIDRLMRFSPEDLDTVDALTAQLQKNREQATGTDDAGSR
jgi:hypothetical protein